VIGVFVGIFLLSANWLVRSISYVYVELLRNTPLLVQLFIWYFVVMLSLPTFQQSITIPQEGYTAIPIRLIGYVILAFVVWRGLRRWSSERRGLVLLALIALVEVLARVGVFRDGVLRFELQPWVFLNIRGFAFPELLPTARFAEWLAFVALGVVLAFILWFYLGRLKEATGQKYPRVLYSVLAILILTVVGWLIVSAEPAPAAIPVANAEGQTVFMTVAEARAAELLTPADELLHAQTPLQFNLPQKTNFRYTVGTQISPEYMALLLGLSIYTSAFIAEIVRAGILAVPRGQVEAARALGLSYGDVLRLVVMPQALRVIIPPLGNQYLNLTKNSSLAIAIAYADVFQVTTTIMNQSGQSVTGMFMVMVTYLALSLIIATVMDRANRRFQLVTR
jgi:general L-amino acid transport system permease protein